MKKVFLVAMAFFACCAGYAQSNLSSKQDVVVTVENQQGKLVQVVSNTNGEVVLVKRIEKPFTTSIPNQAQERLIVFPGGVIRKISGDTPD